MTKKKIMIIAHFCDYGNEKSNNRFNYLADLLSRNNFDVELVTSSFSHRDKKQRQRNGTIHKTYSTTLIYEPSYQENISLKRLFISHQVIAKNLCKYLGKCQKPNLIYCAVPSINISEVAAAYSKKNNIPFFIDVQDLWPEAYRLILKNDFLYRFVTYTMTKHVDRVYASADRVVAVSETYASRVMRVNKKCEEALVVYLGTELEAFDKNMHNNAPLIKKTKNEFWVVYCGTIGHSYDLSIVMYALQKLKVQGIENIRFVVIGSGPLEEKFRSLADELEVSCIFTGKLPYEKMCAQLCECDIAVNPIAKGAAQSIINKHGDYAMAGLPVVSTQESSEYRDLLNKYSCGISCAPDSVDDMCKAIQLVYYDTSKRTKMRKMSRRLAEDKFDRAETYIQILESIKNVF